MLKKIYYAAIISLIFVGNIRSQTSGKLKLSLEDCLEIAEEKNFDIQLIEYQMEASEAQLNSAFGNYLPGLNFNSGFNILNFQQQNVIPIVDNNGNLVINPATGQPQTQRVWEFIEAQNYSMGINASYTVFDGFNREAQYRQAESNFNQTILNSEQTISDVTRDIYLNYIQSIQNLQILKVREENLNVGQKDLERIKAQYDAGAIPISDVYTQEAEVARRELNLIQAQNDLQVSKANLLNVLGLDPSQDVELDVSSLPQEIDDDEVIQFRKKIGSLRSVINTSMKKRRDIEAIEYQKKFNESQIDIAYSNYYPSLLLNGGWNWNNTEFSNFDRNGRFTFGLSLQVPLFDRFQINNQVQSSQLQFEQASVQLEKLKQNVKTSVKTAYLNLESSEKQIYIAKKALKAAELSYRSQQERYELGAANINDVLAANANFISAQIDQINAIYSLLQSQKEIEYQIGLLE